MSEVEVWNKHGVSPVAAGGGGEGGVSTSQQGDRSPGHSTGFYYGETKTFSHFHAIKTVLFKDTWGRFQPRNLRRRSSHDVFLAPARWVLCAWTWPEHENTIGAFRATLKDQFIQKCWWKVGWRFVVHKKHFWSFTGEQILLNGWNNYVTAAEVTLLNHFKDTRHVKIGCF